MSGESSVCGDRPLSSANPRLAPGPTPGSRLRNRSGEERTDRRTEKSTVPPPGPPLHHHYCFDDRKADLVSFRLNTEDCRRAWTLCGKAPNAISCRRLLLPSGSEQQVRFLLIGCARAGCAQADSECRKWVDRSSRLALMRQPFSWYWWRKALATDRFQYGTSKRWLFPVPARRTDESEVYLWRMSSNECRENQHGAARCHNFA